MWEALVCKKLMNDEDGSLKPEVLQLNFQIGYAIFRVASQTACPFELVESVDTSRMEISLAVLAFS